MASDTPTDGNDQNDVSTADAPNADDKQFSSEELADEPAPSSAKGADINLDLVLDIPVNISLRVGTTDISIRDLVRLVEGSVVALDQSSNDAMDVLVNGTLIAHGEIVVVDDKFGVRLTDVVSPVERIENLN